MKKTTIAKSSARRKLRHRDGDDAPALTPALLKRAIPTPPITDPGWQSRMDALLKKPKTKTAKKRSRSSGKDVTLSLEPDVLGWFKSHTKDYQSGINAALRLYILAHEHTL